jgi:hypothetical protein
MLMMESPNVSGKALAAGALAAALQRFGDFRSTGG